MDRSSFISKNEKDLTPGCGTSFSSAGSVNTDNVDEFKLHAS